MINYGAGVVDTDYHGNVGIILFNFGTSDLEVNIGDCIAHLILERISMTLVAKVEKLLTETQRGKGGFGSTSVNEEEEKLVVMVEEDTERKVQRMISPSDLGREQAPMGP